MIRLQVEVDLEISNSFASNCFWLAVTYKLHAVLYLESC